MDKMSQVGVMRPLAVDFTKAGVCVLESHHAKGFSMPAVAHRFHNLLHIFAGRGKLVVAGGELVLKPGSFVFIREGLSHQIEDESGNPLSLYAVCVKSEVLQGFCPKEKLLVSGNWKMNQGLRQTLREILIEQGSGHPEEQLMLHSLAAELVVRITRLCEGAVVFEKDGSFSGELSSRMRVEAYVRDLHNRFFEDENLDEAARRIGVSRRGLTSGFREITGHSRQTWIRKLRIEHARHLLESTDRSIDAVAFECGFNDLSHFYRCFKMEAGKSPKNYRVKHQLN
ncbi:MAG: AraC family transcriptional regulator [Verrucomicrobia bacterium]|nr:AraC family transcriptional regulator [Verrucomicrobiota bacterium]